MKLNQIKPLWRFGSSYIDPAYKITISKTVCLFSKQIYVKVYQHKDVNTWQRTICLGLAVTFPASSWTSTLKLASFPFSTLTGLISGFTWSECGFPERYLCTNWQIGTTSKTGCHRSQNDPDEYGSYTISVLKIHIYANLNFQIV